MPESQHGVENHSARPGGPLAAGLWIDSCRELLRAAVGTTTTRLMSIVVAR